MAKIILNESHARGVFAQMLLEDAMTQDEIAKEVKKALKDKNGAGKEMEKMVKDIVAKCVNNLFKTLWFRHNFYEDEIKR